VFEHVGAEHGYYTSKSFLPECAIASKATMVASPGLLPRLHGHAVVLGAGDTAFDCATSAFRCGASRVTVMFRRSFNEMRVRLSLYLSVSVSLCLVLTPA
jgi:dihydropyrimidine dehydrogenase (NADP+)